MNDSHDWDFLNKQINYCRYSSWINMDQAESLSYPSLGYAGHQNCWKVAPLEERIPVSFSRGKGLPWKIFRLTCLQRPNGIWKSCRLIWGHVTSIQMHKAYCIFKKTVRKTELFSLIRIYHLSCEVRIMRNWNDSYALLRLWASEMPMTLPQQNHEISISLLSQRIFADVRGIMWCGEIEPYMTNIPSVPSSAFTFNLVANV